MRNHYKIPEDHTNKKKITKYKFSIKRYAYIYIYIYIFRNGHISKVVFGFQKVVKKEKILKQMVFFF